jgi:hypothetical protein
LSGGPLVDPQRQSLRTYLNHHLGRAAALTERARQAAKTPGPMAARLAALAKEFDDDRQELLTFMAALDMRVKHLRVLADWIRSRAAELWRRPRREPGSLGPVVDIEALQAGVQRKLSNWKVLRAYVGSRRDEGRRLERLVARAQRQLAELAQLHRQATAVGRSPLRTVVGRRTG